MQVTPTLVEAGAVVELRVELPRLRVGAAPVGLEVEAPRLEVLETELERAWSSETVWRARVRSEAEPGQVPLLLRARFADGASVEVGSVLTVVPAETSSLPWVGLGAALVLAGALLAAGLRLRRRA